MSYLLRSSLKNSLTQFNINTFCVRKGIISRRIAPCVNHLILNYNYANIQGKLRESKKLNARDRGSRTVDEFIKQLDMTARRLGRISLKSVEDVLEEIKALRFASVTQSLMIIRCCGNLLIEEMPEKRTKLVQSMWKVFKDLGVNLDIGHYNALLRVYLENEYDFTPSDILADLEKNGLEPNRVTYQRLITRYCQMGDIAGATRILEFMREKEMPVNVNVFNALILGHSLLNDMESAAGILSVMNQARIEPTSETYTHLICGNIKQKNMDNVNSILKDCELKDLIFSVSDNFNIVYALAENGFESEVDKFLLRLRRAPGYNQEAINVVYRLVSNGFYETAFKILKTMVRNTRSDGSYLPVGNFFIAHLVRCDASSDTIIKMCVELMKEGLNFQAYSIAMENSLRLNKDKTALDLFRHAQEYDIPLRNHYFWPLMVFYGKNKDISGLLNILSVMSKEFKLSPNSETLRDYVIPYILKSNQNVDSMILNLKAGGCTLHSVVGSTVLIYLNQTEIKKAADLAAKYRAYYPPYLVQRPLVNSFLQKKDIHSFAVLLKEICAGISWRINSSDAVKENEEFEVSDHRECVGQITAEIARNLIKKPSCSSELENILQEFLKHDIGLNSNGAKEIQNILQDKLTPEISVLLEKLTSDVFAEPVVSSKNSRLSVSSLDQNSLERLCETMMEKGESVKGIKKQLFILYGRQKDLDKLLTLKKELDAENFVFTSGMLAYLIDTYVEHDKVDDALSLYHNTCETVPNFSLNSTKLLRFALLLVQNDKVEKALEILKSKHGPDEYEDVSFQNSSLSWRILNVFAEKGDVEKIKEFFDVLISHELVEVNNILLGALIKVHIIRNDYDTAMKEFEKCCQKYRCTPWKSELTRTFIEKEDAVNLQKLTDLSTQIHGETNSLYDLMLSFLECGRIRQAKKILETPGMRLRQDRLQTACNKYQNEGAIDHLKNLVAVTRNFSSIDRSNLFFNLLSAYDKVDDAQEALGLWMQMQEEDVQPSDSFLILLASILNRHNISVPFSVPESKPISSSNEFENRLRISSYSQTLRKYLNANNLDKAMEFKQKTKREQLNKTDWSLLIEGCLKHNRYKDAVQLFNEFFSLKGDLPHIAILKYLMKSAMLFGDIDFINHCNNILPEEYHYRLIFHDIRCRTYLNASKIEEYLTELEQKLDNIQSPEEFQSFTKIFPKGGLVTTMKLKPEHINQIKRILEKCRERDCNFIIPNNIMWLHYMIQKNFDEARQIWNNSLSDVNSYVSFQAIISDIQQKEDTELGMVLIEMLKKKSNITLATLSVPYASTIDALVKKNNVEEAIKLLHEAVKTIPLRTIKQSTLVTLKVACEAKNIEFPFTLPEKTFDRRNYRRQLNNAESDSDFD